MDELSSFLSSLVYYFQQRTLITMFAFIHFQIVSFHLTCSHLRLAEFPISRMKKKNLKIPQQFGRIIADNLLVLEKGLEGVGGIFKNYFVHLKSFSRFSWRAVFTSPEQNCWRRAEVFPLQQQPQFSSGAGISLCSLKHSFTWKALCGTHCKCRTITQLLSSDAGMRKLEGGNRKDINTSLQSFIFYSHKGKPPVDRAPRDTSELLHWWIKRPQWYTFILHSI